MHYLLPDSDRQLWLLKRNPETPEAATVLQHWLSELLGERPDIQRTGAGKPYLTNRALQFNFSHSQTWFALAWQLGSTPIGVDIEDLDRRSRFPALAARYFHLAEYAQWLSADEHQRNTTWLRTWTRKEAVLKAHGLGLRVQLNTLDTCRDAVQHPLIGAWHLHSFYLPDAVVSVSWPTAASP